MATLSIFSADRTTKGLGNPSAAPQSDREFQYEIRTKWNGGIIPDLDSLYAGKIDTIKSNQVLVGIDSSTCIMHLYTETGAICERIESNDAAAGIMQLQLYNDSGLEMSLGKLGSTFDFNGVGSGAIFNRSGNFNIIQSGNYPIIIYSDTSDSQTLTSFKEIARFESDGEFNTKGLHSFSGGGAGLQSANLWQHDAATIITIAGANQVATVDGFRNGYNRGISFQGDSALVVHSTGLYQCQWSCSFAMTAGSNIEVEGWVLVNGVQDSTITSHRKIATGIDTGDMGAVGILSLTDLDTVTFGMINETDANNIDVEHCQLVLTLIGG